MSEKQLLKKKSENLTQWYTDVVTKAQLMHYSSIKGIMTFLPNSWAIWEQIQCYLNKQFSQLGIQNIALPSLIPESLFEKEKVHISGFNPELFRVTSVGEKKLSDSYILRPTSEVTVSQLFRDLILSANQLPILFNQWGNIFRAEKNTRPFLRNCEFFWQEIHGAFETSAQAHSMALQILDVYANLLNNVLLIPTLSGMKTLNERFAGADISYTHESIMPDGQALQCATSHLLGTSFSSIYDVKFQNSNNTFTPVEMISAGISTRILGGIIMQHGDDFGLVVPFLIAPVQVIINSMMYRENKDVGSFVDKIYHQMLKKYRTKIDFSNKSISQKIIQSELIGIPIQLIIGPKEVKSGTLTVFNRLTRSKKNISVQNYEKYVDDIVRYWKTDYYKVKLAEQERYICKVNNCEEMLKMIKMKKVCLAPWGGDIEAEMDLKQKYGITARCVFKKIDKNSKIKCFFTNNLANELIYFARSY